MPEHCRRIKLSTNKIKNLIYSLLSGVHFSTPVFLQLIKSDYELGLVLINSQDIPSETQRWKYEHHEE
jgi:hypothetical protein